MAARIVVTGTRGIPNVSGGVETHVEKLFPIFTASDNFEVHICCRDCYIPRNKRLTSYKNCILTYIRTPKKKSFEAIVHTWRSILYAKKVRADIVHIHAIGPALLVPVARLMRMKVVFTHHGPDYERQKWGFLAKSMLRIGEYLGCKFANKVIVISKTIERSVKSKYRKSNIYLIPNGVEIPVLSNQENYLNNHNLQKNNYVLTVARLVPEKGIHDLIRAYIASGVKEKLVIAGDADHETDYSLSLKKNASNPNIIFTGYIKGEELHQIFSNTALFVLPSYHEGLPIALLEALSYSRNVLVSDIEPHAELDLGKNHYFKTGDVKDLCRTIKSLLARKQAFDDGFIPLLQKKYNWVVIAKKTESLYRMLLQ